MYALSRAVKDIQIFGRLFVISTKLSLFLKFWTSVLRPIMAAAVISVLTLQVATYVNVRTPS